MILWIFSARSQTQRHRLVNDIEWLLFFYYLYLLTGGTYLQRSKGRGLYLLLVTACLFGILLRSWNRISCRQWSTSSPQMILPASCGPPSATCARRLFTYSQRPSRAWVSWIVLLDDSSSGWSIYSFCSLMFWQTDQHLILQAIGFCSSLFSLSITQLSSSPFSATHS